MKMKPTKHHPGFVPPEDRPISEIVSHGYQPSKAELEADLRVNATFTEAVDALTRPVRIRYIDHPKPAP